ncbi:hypothetical protein CHUAL_000490 [Chamberlinius hualienensis]
MDSDEPPSKRCRKNLFDNNFGDAYNNIESSVTESSIEDATTGLQELRDEIQTTVLRRIPDGSYVSSTSSDKTRFYLRLLPSDYFEECNINFSKDTPDSKFLPSLFAELRNKIRVERDSELDKKISYIKGETVDAQPELTMKTNNFNSPEKLTNLTDILWVEKFKPRHFMELLSDDGTNRTLLRWLRLWDKVVFNREVKLRPLPDTVANNQKGFKNHSNKFKKLTPLTEELDKSHCPIQKIALLCGPPGLGKTTLAHVIASQAGYNVVEMNASDDRSIEKFHNSKVKSTMKESKVPLLPRPIICICNNQFASSLRQLRMNALIINFPSTTSNRLASRLMEISKTEKLKTDLSTLMALCVKAENDIRSCISTLQFVTRKKRMFHMADVHCLPCGQKDIQRSLFSVWQTLFQIPKSSVSNTMKYDPEKAKELLKSSGHEESRFEKILALSQSTGEHDKIHQGVFENFPMMKFKEHNMKNCTYGSEWLCFADIFQQEINHSQNYSILPYIPFATVGLHYAFASNAFPKVTFPSSHFQHKTKVTSCKNVLANIIDEVPPCLRSHLNLEVLVIDLLPYLIKVIQPQFRPVNVQLYSTEEKALFDHVVHVMIAYNLNYQQQIGQDGQYNFVFEPQFDIISCFPEVLQPIISYATKQAVAYEIKMEKMRREDEKHKAHVIASIDIKPVEQRKENVPSFMKQSLQPKPVVEKPCVDFFGRVVNKTSVVSNQENVTDVLKNDVWYHFKEGYSNATRRKIRMKDL